MVQVYQIREEFLFRKQVILRERVVKITQARVVRNATNIEEREVLSICTSVCTYAIIIIASIEIVWRDCQQDGPSQAELPSTTQQEEGPEEREVDEDCSSVG